MVIKGSHLFYTAATAVLVSCGVTSRSGIALRGSDPAAHHAKYYPGPEEATYFYTEGLKNSIMQGDPRRSEALFGEVLRLDSLHAPTWYELANLYAGSPEKAIPYSRKALGIDSTNVYYLAQLGQLYLQGKTYDSALRVYNKLLELSPANPDNYMRIAALYEQQKQPFSAIAMLDSAETRFGILEGPAAYKRQLLTSVKLYDKALREARELAANFPYDPANFVALAEIYAAMGKDSLTRDAYRQAQALSPKNTQMLASMNEYYKRRGDDANFLATTRELFDAEDIPLETKIGFFKEITSSTEFYRNNYLQLGSLASNLAIRYPNDFRITELYANHLIGSGQLNDALALYKSRIGDSVPNRKVFTQILEIESYLKRPDSVAKYATLALEKFPSDADLYLRKGFGMFFFMEDYAGAEKEFLKALKLADSDSLRGVIYASLGDNAQKQGNSKACFDYYKKGLKYDPDNSMILNNYSYYLSERDERLDEADRMAKRANELSPNNATFIDTRAWVLYKMGRYEEAKTLMQQALALDNSGSEELFLHYGDIFYALKDNFMAVFYWKKALEKGYNAEQIEKRLKLVETK